MGQRVTYQRVDAFRRAQLLDYFERRRRRRDLEDEAIRDHRLPPGQSLTVKWPVLSAGPAPRFDPLSWRFRLMGEVDEPQELTWDEFSALPRVTRTSDIHCVTHWTKLDNTWEGVLAAEVVSLASVRPEAQFVTVHAPDYTANLPLALLLDDETLFAFSHDGQLLPPQHGGPLRLVAPKRYFWKSVKWVNGLEFTREDQPGFWEERGYHMEGDPWSEERYGFP